MNDALRLVCDENTRLIVTKQHGELVVKVQRLWKGDWLTFAEATKEAASVEITAS